MNKKTTSVILSFLLVLNLIFFFGILTFAQSDNEFQIEIPDGYITAFLADDKTEVANVIGITAKEVDDYFKNNYLEFLSVSEDNTSQIKLSVLADEFSSKIFSFNNLGDEQILKLANSLFTGSYEQVSDGAKIVRNNSVKFLKYEETLTDNGGEYTVTQYVTVYNGKTYRLSVFIGGQEKNLSDTVFESLTFNQLNEGLSPLTKIFIIVGIVIFAVIIVLSIFR